MVGLLIWHLSLINLVLCEEDFRGHWKPRVSLPSSSVFRKQFLNHHFHYPFNLCKLLVKAMSRQSANRSLTIYVLSLIILKRNIVFKRIHCKICAYEIIKTKLQTFQHISSHVYSDKHIKHKNAFLNCLMNYFIIQTVGCVGGGVCVHTHPL